MTTSWHVIHVINPTLATMTEWYKWLNVKQDMPTKSSLVFEANGVVWVCCQFRTQCWKSVSMDFIMSLLESSGFHAIYIVVDRFSKVGLLCANSRDNNMAKNHKVVFQVGHEASQAFKGYCVWWRLWSSQVKSKLEGTLEENGNGVQCEQCI